MEAAIVLVALGLAALTFFIGFFLGRETKDGGGAAPATTQVQKEHPGKAVFASAGCTACHTLSAAGATGTVGPNLDETTLDAGQIAQVVTNGRRAMPPFEGKLSEQQIKDVAAFVAGS